MPLVKVADLAALRVDDVMEVQAGGKTLAICNAGGTIHALDGVCPHRDGPLGQGAVADGKVVCPWHAWEFDCRSGVNDYNPMQRVRVYPVTVAGNEIFVDLP